MKRATIAIVLAWASASAVGAQQWNDSRVLELVRQATDRRAQQLADSGLTDYHATAHGYLTFLAQLGEGFHEPPQVVKADELALEVYWRSPNLSKQVVVGRRDTTLLPTDIAYHRDHLGIVQNNFPAIIRLGEGDEVRDVPHPLSVAGLTLYDFALADSLRILIPGRAISVYEVKVRPKDDRQPRVIGALYLDRDNGQVVRMALSFTKASFLDKYLEDLFVVLENGLVGTRFWLPRRQEVEIRRTATWLDYPVRGIIRGRWEIQDYEINAGLQTSMFFGPEITFAPAEVQRSHQWPSARILDSLPPDVRAITADEVKRVQQETRALVREQALRRAQGSMLAARGISDFARFNRIEGASLGLGLSWRFGAGIAAGANGRYGLDDHSPKGRVQLGWQGGGGSSLSLYAERTLRDVGIVAERSALFNSLAAQEFGSDYTDTYRLEAIGAAASIPKGNWTWTLSVAEERHRALTVHAAPAQRIFQPAFPADSADRLRALLVGERRTALWTFGSEMRARFEIRPVPARFAFDVEVERPIGAARVVSRSIGGAVFYVQPAIAYSQPAPAGPGTSAVLAQDWFYFGGPITAPGYGFHSLDADHAVSQRLELRFPVPFWPISLGRFGHSGASMTLAPYVSAVALEGGRQVDGVYPSAGVGVLTLFDVLRFDVARGLRGGRWMFSVDANRMLWPVM